MCVVVLKVSAESGVRVVAHEGSKQEVDEVEEHEEDEEQEEQAPNLTVLSRNGLVDLKVPTVEGEHLKHGKH